MTATPATLTNTDRVTLRKFRDWARASWVAGSVSNRVCPPLVDRGLLEQRQVQTGRHSTSHVIEYRLTDLGRQAVEAA